MDRIAGVAIALLASALAIAGPAQADDEAETCATDNPALLAETDPEAYLGCIQKQARASGIQAFSDRWVACYEARDAACISDLYDPDAVLMSQGGMPLRGDRSIEAYFAGLFLACEDGETAAMTLALDSIEASDERAIVVEQWRAAGTVDGQAVERSGRTLLLLRMDSAGAWKIWRQMDADLIAPPAETECPAIM